MIGDLPGGPLPHVGDAEAEEQAVQGAVRAGFDTIQQVAGGLLAHALQRPELLEGQAVDVTHVPDQAAPQDLLGDRRPEPFDVHGVPAREVGDPRLRLGRTGRVAATPRHLFAHARERGFAHRAGRRHLEGRRPVLPLVQVGRNDLGDHVSALFDPHGIADAQVLAADLFLVVERGPADRRPGQEDRFEFGHRSHHAGPADLQPDVCKTRPGPLRGELAGDGPSGTLHRGAEFAVQ